MLAAKGTDHITSVSGLTGITLNEAYQPEFGNQYAMLNPELPGKEDRADPNKFIKQLQDELAEFTKDPGRFRLNPRQGGPPADHLYKFV